MQQCCFLAVGSVTSAGPGCSCRRPCGREKEIEIGLLRHGLGPPAPAFDPNQASCGGKKGKNELFFHPNIQYTFSQCDDFKFGGFGLDILQYLDKFTDHRV